MDSNGKMVRRRFWTGDPGNEHVNQYSVLDRITVDSLRCFAVMVIEDALGIGQGMTRDCVLYHLRRSLGSATVDTILTEIAVDKAHEKSAKELRLGKAVTS